MFGHRPAVDYTNMGVDIGITNAVSLEIEESQNAMFFSTPEEPDLGTEEAAASTTDTSGDTSSIYGGNSESGKKHSVDLEDLFEKQREWEEKMMHEQMEAHAQMMRETVQEMGSVFFACVSQLSKSRDTNE
uniref:uncharacterized protein LOC120333007 isoform X1 n=1 Tax=Styela clava TaxID=7725 RepID=UPI00193AC44A|nr:uncharacterized protein LOC120333007 isoform X1 [Styela clava]